MNYFKNSLTRLLNGVLLASSLFLAAGTAHARTNDLYVDSVVMDDLRNIELNPGDPIRYTVSYGREVATGSDKHGEQRVRVSVYLSTDGDPENNNNFLLDFFDDIFPKDATAADPRTYTLTDRLPPNFTGTYFLLAKIRVTGGSADSAAADDIPAVNITAAARVTIRPYDSPTVSRISTSASGTESNELSESPSISADGRYVVFQSEATNLVSTPTAPAGISQIYLRDTLTNEVKLISQLGGVAGNAESKFPVISSKGADDLIAGSPRYYIAYQSSASNLVSGTGANDTNQQTDIFLYDLANATTTLISVPTGSPAGVQANGGSFLPSISGDGNLIAFESLASNLLGKGSNGVLLDTNGKFDVYVYNRTTKVVTAASATAAGVLGNGDSTQARISENGSTVVFRSFAGNLAVGAAAPIPRSEILAKSLVTDVSTGRIERISVLREAFGAGTRSFTALNRDAFDPAVSSDGRYVAFATRATNTTAPNGDTNDAGLSQVYVVNRAVNVLPGAILNPSSDYDAVGNTSLNLVSTGISPLDPLPGFADDESVAPVISGDGRYIGFRTEASDLQPTTVMRSDGRVFQTKSSGVIGVIPDNTAVVVDMPIVTIKDGGGTGATAHAIVSNGQITGIVIDSAGAGYSATADPKLTVEITGGGGSGAEATATIGTVDGVVDAISSITVTKSGRGYPSADVVFTNGVGAGASGIATLTPGGGVQDVSMLSNGYGYNPQFTQIDFSAPDAPSGGVKPEAVPVIENGIIYDIVVISQGSGYLTAPVVSVNSTPLISAMAQVTFESGKISEVDMLDYGAGYVSAPDVSIEVTDSTGTTSYPALAIITDGLFTNAINSYSDFNNSSDVYIRDTGIKSIIVTQGGTGYTSDILLDSTAITGGGGSSAAALAIVEDGVITRIDLLNSGSCYLTAPTITLPDSPTGGLKATASAILTEGSDRVSISHYGQETVGLIGGFEVPSSRSITMSSNGRYMLFTSEASNSSSFIFGKSNQIPLDQNKKRDIFVVDRKISQAVTPVRGTAPTVTISIDTRDLTFNSSRVISASAFDGGDVIISGDEQLPQDGVIKSIDIYANNIKIASNSAVGTGSTMLLDAVYTAPQVAGPTQLYAVTVDGNGNRVYSTPQIINIVAPQTQRPSVTLSSSTSTLTVGGTFVLSAIATDPENSIFSVSFYSNGLLLFVDPIPPYQYSYTPTYSGEYKLTAIVSDNDPALIAGQVGAQVRNDSISNEIVLRVLPPPSPTIYISSPVEAVTAATLGQPVFLELSATTTNPAASISSVQIMDNGKLLPGIAQRQGLTASYRYTWYPTTTGLHTITAVATDSQQGTSESSSRDFVVSTIIGTAPVVDIISPAADALPILTQDIVNFQVRASDLGGTIRSTVIYGNGARLGSATFNPATGYWELPVDASLLATGLYDFVAVSTDNDGNSIASAVRSLSVVISAPVVSIVTPALSSGVTVVDTKVDQPLVFIVRAFTRDSFSRVSNVTLSANGTSIGQATQIGNTDQYSFTWLPTTTGVFQIVASASDTKGGGAQTAELNIRVTELVGTAPTVQIVAPASTGGTNPIPASAALGSQVLFIATAFDNTSVSAVNFFADGILIGAASPQGTTNQWVLNATLSGAPFSAKGVGSYAITAIASDADLNQTQSAVTTLAVTSGVTGSAPTGSLIFPAAASVQTLGQAVALQALASDVDGAIASVAFYANGVLVDTDASAPFTGTWTPTVAGSYNLVLVITDAQGATTVTAPVAVTVNQSAAPSVSLVSPVSATSLAVGSVLPLQATASDNDGTIASVGFYADGALVATGVQVGNTTTYTASWTPAQARSGAYKLTVKATDNVGLVTETAAVNVTVTTAAGSAPVVAVTSPAAAGQNQAAQSAALGSQVLFAANASDNIAVTGVNFFADGVLIGAASRQGTTNQWTLALTLNGTLFNAKGVGSYAITAIAADADGNQTLSVASTLNVTAAVSGSAPNVVNTFPSSGQTLTLGRSLTLIINARDTDGTIASVSAYANGILVGTTTAEPFSFTWTPTLAGNYNLVYVVTDSQGVSTVTAPTAITVLAGVNNVPVSASLFPNAQNNDFTNASVIPLVVNVADADQPSATAHTVTFYVDGVIVPATPTRLGNSGSYLVEYATSGLLTGVHQATAIVSDASGNITSSSSAFTIRQATGASFSAKPSLTANGGTAITITAGDTFNYALSATRPNGRLTQMEIFLNGISTPSTATAENLSQNPVTTAPFVSTWYAGQLNGKSTTFALATDNVGNVMVSNLVEVTRLDNGEPTIRVISPTVTTTTTLGQSLVMDVEAKATTAGDVIKSVVFLSNNELVAATLVTRLPGTDIWRVSFTPTVANTYSLKAIATTRGATTNPADGVPFERSATSDARSFVLSPVVGVAPSVVLITPVSSVSSGGNTPVQPAVTTSSSRILLVARTTPGSANITSVEFFARSALGGTTSLTTGTLMPLGNTYQADVAPLSVGSYEIFAVALDLNGNRSVSNITTLNVTASSTTAPVVSLAVPVPSSVVEGRSTLLAATATPATGATISSVAFYVNGALENTDATAPYSVSYTAPAVGSYKVVAVATDSAGNTSVSTEQSFTVTGNVAPVATFVGPQGTALLPFKVANNTSVTLQADASDADGSIAEVAFYANGTLVGTQTQAASAIANRSRYVQEWAPTLAGTYTLTVIATDNQGTSTTSAAQTVEVTALGGSLVPTVTLANPDAGENFTSASKVRLAASAADPDGNLVQVEFYVNGALIGTASRVSSLNPAAYPFSTEWSVGAAGIYTIVAVAQDTSNNRTMSAPVTVTATTGTSAPSVTLGVLPATATLGNVLNLSASASDAGGVVTTVAFYVNGNPVAIDDTTPYVASYTPATAGLYEITAVALDDSGNETVSAVSTVTVNPIAGTAPSIVLTSPAAAATGGTTPASLTIGQASTLNLIAQVTPGSAAISEVKFYAMSAQNGPTLIGTGSLLAGGSFRYQSTYASALTIGDYNLVAVVSDAAGNTVTSGNVGIKVVPTATTAPVVSLAVPVPSSVVEGRSTLLAATATSVAGTTISSVAFYVNGALVNTDATAPYSVSYTAPAVGSYKVVAVATDSAGNTSVSTEQSLEVTRNAGPVVSISAPVLTVELGTPLAISATATDVDGIDRVVFTEYLGTAINDAIKTTEDRLSPYGYQFNPSQTGQYIIRAEAIDDLGFSDTASLVVNVVRNTAKPTIAFVSPDVGATAVVGQATPVEVSVTVPTGATVNSITFYANGVKIGDGYKQGTLDLYRLLVDQNNTQLPWSPSVTGSLALTAEIVDSFGGRAETTVARQIQVVGQVGALPFVEIIQPVPPATTTGGTPASLTATTNSDLNLAASAVDSDGTVSSVEFFLDRGRPATPTASVTFPSVVVNGAALQQSTGYISSIAFTDGGTGYLSPPEVRIIGDGVGATAEAEILNGAISRIRVTNRGSGYTNAIVRLVGGGLVENLSIGSADPDFDSDVWRLATPFNFKSYGAGFYTFRAVARDSNNNVQSSAEVSVTVSPAPLTTPVTGNVVSTPSTANLDGQRVPAGQTVQLALNPTVVGGTVASVEFYANGESVGADTVAPYIVNWVPSYVGSYNVVAVVTDSVGNQGLSPATPVYVGGNIAPTLTLVRPEATGSTGVVNQVVLLEAEASAKTPGATVSTVEFNADGESVGIASQVGTTNRFVLSTWRPASAKPYSITARVVDSFGQAFLTSARVITVQAQTGVIPTVVLTAPAAAGATGNSNDPFAPSATTGGNRISNNSALFLSAQANDADGSVFKVEFLMSRGQQATARAILQNFGTGVGAITVGAGSSGTGTSSASGAGYLYAPRVKIVGNGVGAVAEAVVTNGSVTSIRVLSPGSGYTFTPQVVIEGGGLYENLVVGTAVNAPGTLTWSTALDLRNYDVGPYFLSARVTDNQGNTSISSTAAVNVTPATASAPVVTLSAPSPATIELGLTSNFVAIPTTAVGVTVTKVDFYANGSLVSSATTAPYLLAFTAPSAGSYEIYSIVTDSAGNATLSQARTLTVKALAPVETMSQIDDAYQAILNRSATSEEIKSALAQHGASLTSGQVVNLILQSSDYRDNQAKLILSYQAVWGIYPNSFDYADLQAKKLGLTTVTDGALIDAVLASASYKQRYGDIADLSITNPTQYNRVREFALRIYRNLYGSAPAKAATANTVAQQFFYTISTGGTPGQAVVNFINANFGNVSKTPVVTGTTGGTSVTPANLQLNTAMLNRLRLAGVILLIGNEQPTAARIKEWSGSSLAAVADYYFAEKLPFTAGTMVSIETATESVAGTTYYASGLPKGLTIDRTTGVISGRLPSAVKAYAITYWSQNKGVRSASTTRILMVEALEAKFIGSNEALLVDADGLPAGKLTVKVASTADYTGTLVYRDGGTYSFKGVLSVVFDEDGVSTAFGQQTPIKRKAPRTALDVGLFFDADGLLSTSVTEGKDMTPVASGDAIRVFTFTKAAPAPWRGSYTVRLLDVSDLPHFAKSAGSGTLKVANTGVLSVALVGKDGAKITGSVSGSLASDYRLYLRPYSKKPLGYFAGEVRFSDESTPSEVEFPVIGNDLTWFRPAGLAPIPDGFGPLKIQLDYAAPAL